mmetsp:Transcript_794/g.820  ORF Transcript_794/g.820 Transcript_794/m.820 type:complete len:1058 (-) Transcript_794:428-3601(-)
MGKGKPRTLKNKSNSNLTKKKNTKEGNIDNKKFNLPNFSGLSSHQKVVRPAFASQLDRDLVEFGDKQIQFAECLCLFFLCSSRLDFRQEMHDWIRRCVKDPSGATYVHSFINQNLKNVKNLLQRYLFTVRPTLLGWNVPKFTYFTNDKLAYVPGKKGSVLQYPFFIVDANLKSKNQCVHGKYVIAFAPMDSVVFEDEMSALLKFLCTNKNASTSEQKQHLRREFLFRFSNSSIEVFVKNLAMSVQGYVDAHPEILGASLILSGLPSANLLFWIRGMQPGEGKEKDKLNKPTPSPIPDVEVLFTPLSYHFGLAKPHQLPKHSSKDFLFELKPSRRAIKNGIKLKKSNQNEELKNALKEALSSKGIRLSIDHILNDALNKLIDEMLTNLIPSFENWFNRFVSLFDEILKSTLNPSLEPTSIVNHSQLEQSLSEYFDNRKIVPRNSFSERIIKRAHLTNFPEYDNRPELFRLDWNHIIGDCGLKEDLNTHTLTAKLSEKEKDYESDQFFLINNNLVTSLNNAPSRVSLHGAPLLLVFKGSPSSFSANISVSFTPDYLFTTVLNPENNLVAERKFLSLEPASCLLLNICLFFAQLSLPSDDQNLIDTAKRVSFVLSQRSGGDRVVKSLIQGIEKVQRKDFNLHSGTPTEQILYELFCGQSSSIFDKERVCSFLSLLKVKFHQNNIVGLTVSQLTRVAIEKWFFEKLLEISLFGTGLSLLSFKNKLESCAGIDFKPLGDELQQFQALLEKLSTLDTLPNRKYFYLFDYSLVTEPYYKFIYVILPNEVRLANEPYGSTTRPTHSELAGGRPVLTAGELVMEKRGGKWYLISVNNGSGHYRPTPSSLEHVKSKLIDPLHEQGVEIMEAVVCGCHRPDLALGSLLDYSVHQDYEEVSDITRQKILQAHSAYTSQNNSQAKENSVNFLIDGLTLNAFDNPYIVGNCFFDAVGHQLVWWNYNFHIAGNLRQQVQRHILDDLPRYRDFLSLELTDNGLTENDLEQYLNQIGNEAVWAGFSLVLATSYLLRLEIIIVTDFMEPCRIGEGDKIYLHYDGIHYRSMIQCID